MIRKDSDICPKSTLRFSSPSVPQLCRDSCVFPSILQAFVRLRPRVTWGSAAHNGWSKGHFQYFFNCKGRKPNIHSCSCDLDICLTEFRA